VTDTDPGSAQSRRERWDERHTAHDPIESLEPDPTLVEACATMAPGHALDLGSGDGRNAIWLAQRGWRVSAVDFSSVALARAGARAEASGVEIDWRLEDLLERRPAEGLFDLVTLIYIHLPTEERRAVYARAAAAVTPGGTLLVVGHDRSNLTEGVGGPQDPEVLFTPAEIVAELPVEFEIERAEVVRRRRGDGPGPVDAVVRAKRSPLSGG
jgi:2-polyprenyl-3-methyl-5-hydroxy-6-metoxy-1,4-benzoquinol methylase